MDTSILQPGDCILIGGASFISRGIKLFTGSKYSHCMMYVGGGDGFVIEAIESGVEKTPLSKAIKGATDICARRIPGLTVEQVECMKDKAYSLIYEDYDYLQIAGLAVYQALKAIGIKWMALIPSNSTKMICSELYAVCAMTIPLKFKVRAKLVTPETLASTTDMKTIYEEKIK